jgi:hypothetical protein
VRVQALQRAGATRAADAEVERGATVTAGRAGRELAADRALLLVSLRPALGKLRILRGRARPAFDTADALEPGDCGDEVAARDVVRRRERLTVGVVRLLLGDRGTAERAADDHAFEGTRLTAELAGDDGAISIHNGPIMLNELDGEEIAGIERVLRQAQQNAQQNETVAAFLASVKAELRERGYEWNGTNVVPTEGSATGTA